MATTTATVAVLVTVVVDVEILLPEPDCDGEYDVTEAEITRVVSTTSLEAAEVQEALMSQDAEQLDDAVRKAMASRGLP